MQQLASEAHLRAVLRRDDAQCCHQHLPAAQVLAAAACCCASGLCSPTSRALPARQLQLQLQRGAVPGKVTRPAGSARLISARATKSGAETP